MHKCHNCGKEFEGRFCPECGVEFPADAASVESDSKISGSLDKKDKPKCSDGLDFELEFSEYVVSGLGSCEDKDIVIPAEHDGRTVVSIGDQAFFDCEDILSVSIPSSVTAIGESAFDGCEELMSVNIPDSVTFIGDKAFDSCYSLKSISIPSSVTEINESAFWGCISLTTVIIPDSVTMIASSAFEGCTALKDVYYSGSKSQWESVFILEGNKSLNTATIHFNCKK